MSILSPLYSLFPDWWLAIKYGIPRTWKALISQPRILLHPSKLSGIFFAFVWERFAPLVDEGSRPVKEALVRPHAYGIVLDVGAGHGHTIPYLERSRVSKYIAVEPNVRMHSKIRDMAQKHGFSAQEVEVLGCGAEQVDVILATLGGQQCDTIVSILTLCTIPSPQVAISALTRSVLKPGGQLLWYEHILSPLSNVRMWQRLLTPLWAAAFDGCRLDLDTPAMILSACSWSTTDMWDKPGEVKDGNMFWHQVGRFIKAQED